MTTETTTPRSPERQAFLTDVLITLVESSSAYSWWETRSYRWYDPKLRGGQAEPGPGNTPNAHAEMRVIEWDSVKDEIVPVSDWKRIDLDTIEAVFDRLVAGPIKHLSERGRGELIAAWATNNAGEVDADLADIVGQIAMLQEVTFG